MNKELKKQLASFLPPGADVSEILRNLKTYRMPDWLRLVEALIAAHSSPPRTRGKYKGHGSTDAVAWVRNLVPVVWLHIRLNRKGIAYDENMALASRVGAILVAWYTNVHRAKAYDAHRPIGIRRRVLRRRSRYIADLVELMNSDALMAAVWSGQEFNPPHGKQARGGKFL